MFIEILASMIMAVAMVSSETYQVFLTSRLSPGVDVASLNTLTESRSTLRSYKVLEISKTDLLSSSSVVENDASRIQAALECQKYPVEPRGFFQYFCVDQSTYTIRTSASYNPPEGVNMIINFKIQLNWSQGFSEVNILRISILDSCQAQREVYIALTSCQPFVFPVKPQLIDGAFRYRLDSISRFTLQSIQLGWQAVRHIESRQTKLIGMQIVYGDTEKFKTVDLTALQSTNVSLFLTFPLGTEEFTLSIVDDRWQRILFPTARDITFFLYDTQNFCERFDCLLKLNNWMLLMNDVRYEEKICVADRLEMRNSLNTCYESINVFVESAPSLKGGFSERDRLRLFCNHSEILLPFKIHWFHIKGGIIAPTDISSPQLDIPSISRAQWGAFVCRVSSLDSGYTSSNRFHVYFKDLIWIRLEMLVGQLKFTSAYGDPYGESSQQLMTTLRNAVFRSIIRSGLFRNRAPDLTAFQLRNDSSSGLTWLVSDFYVTRLQSNDNEIGIFSLVSQAVMNGSSGAYGDLFGVYSITRIRMASERACGQDATEVGKWESYTLVWPATFAGETVAARCPENSPKNAYRTCKMPALAGDFAAWAPVDASQCTFDKELQYVLRQLNKESTLEQRVSLIAEKLERISSRPDAITRADELNTISSVLHNLTARLSDDVQLQGRVFRTIDNILAVNKTLFHESQAMYGTSARFVNLLGSASEVLLTSKNEVSVSMQNFALAGQTMPTRGIEGMIVDLYRWKNSSMQIEFRDHGTSHLVGASPKATLIIPNSIRDALPKENVNVVLVSYGFPDDLLFPRSNSSSFPAEQWMADTEILSAELRGVKIQNLTKPIKLHFVRKSSEFPHSVGKCVFWDFDSQDWSTRGCVTKEESGVSNATSCECNHLTNFAVLFSAVPPAGIHGRILTIVTYFCIAVSLLGAILTLLTHAVFPMLRKTIPPKILMNLCMALIFLMVLFLLGVERPEGTLGCKLIAILLQFFFLAVFFWSAVEGFHSVRGLVFPMRAEIPRFLQKAFLVAWGAPVGLTAIGAGIWHREYGKKAGCVVRNLPFYLTVLAPLTAILIGNCVALGLILKALSGKATKHAPQAIGLRDRLRIITGFVLLFGLTWIFGFLVIDQTCVVCQYIFCATGSLQGLYLFVFYGLRNEKIRQYWLDLFRGLMPKSVQRKTPQPSRTDERASRATFLSETK